MNNNTNMKKKKQPATPPKPRTPPKTKTTHKIEQPIVKLEEVVISKINTNSKQIPMTIGTAKVMKKISKSPPKTRILNTNTHMNTNTITNSQSPTTTTKGRVFDPIIAAELAQFLLTVVHLLDEDIVECVYGMLMEDPSDEDTR